MRRALQVKRGGHWEAGHAVGVVVLDAEDRGRRRAVLTTEDGVRVLLDLPQPAHLRDGDALVLEDGGLLRVVAKPEPVLEIAAPSAAELARLAWHLGNRHAEVEVAGERLRIRRDHVLAEMLRGLGARVIEIEAPFEPEAGAYGGHGHDEGHEHGADGRAQAHGASVRRGDDDHGQ